MWKNFWGESHQLENLMEEPDGDEEQKLKAPVGDVIPAIVTPTTTDKPQEPRRNTNRASRARLATQNKDRMANLNITKDPNVRRGRGSLFFFSKPNAKELEELQGKDPVEYWAQLANEWDDGPIHREKICRLIGQGIPNLLRSILWPLLANVASSQHGERYSMFVDSVSPVEEQIRKDLDRTFPNTEFFKDADGVGQETLFRVIKAYSLYDSQMGYCQGLCFIVGMLLLQLPEEEAFVVLIYIMEKLKLRAMFLPEMPLIKLANFHFAIILENHCPEISERFRREGVDHPMYITKWFLTMFAASLPLPVCLHLMDLVLTEGHLRPYGALEILYQVAIAILKENETYIMTHPFEELLNFLNSGLMTKYEASSEDTERRNPNAKSRQLLKSARSIDLDYKELEYWKAKYDERKSLSEKEQSEVQKLKDEKEESDKIIEELSERYDALREKATMMLKDLRKKNEELTKNAEEVNQKNTTLQNDMTKLKDINERLTFHNQEEREMLKNHMMKQNQKYKVVESDAETLKTENNNLRLALQKAKEDNLILKAQLRDFNRNSK